MCNIFSEPFALGEKWPIALVHNDTNFCIWNFEEPTWEKSQTTNFNASDSGPIKNKTERWTLYCSFCIDSFNNGKFYITKYVLLFP